MAAEAWKMYNTAREYIGDGTIDLDSHTFKSLLVSSSYTPDYETHTVLADITNELSGNGYARYTLTMTWNRSTTTVTLDSDDVTQTASGGAITARREVIFDDTPSSPADPLLCAALLDSTPADVSVSDGNTLTIARHPSGILALTGAT